MLYKTETQDWVRGMAERHAERVSEKNTALREALRLKELEREALADDKDSLARDVKNCISELRAWADEYQDDASDLFIKEIESRLNEVVGSNEKQTR